MMKYISLIFLVAACAGAVMSLHDHLLRAPDAISSGHERVAYADPFDGLSVGAHAAIVFDLRTGRTLYEKNAELQFPLASLTKVMSALVAKETSPDALVTITEDALAAEGDSGLLRDERWHLSDLIDYTLMTSSNDGARALAAVGSIATEGEPEHKNFVDRMNEKAHTLGMAQTFFLNTTGLDEGSTTSGAYGSARDVARLFAYTVRTHPDIFSATTREKLEIASLDTVHTAINTDSIVSRVPGIIASKTGFTDLAGGNLAIAFEAGPLHPIVIVVLGSTEEGRFDDVAALVDATIKTIAGSN